MPNLNTVFVFLLQATVVFVGLAVFGYPIVSLLRRFTRRREVVVATPLLGIFPLAQISWLWSRYGEGGLHAVIPIALGLFAVASVILWLIDHWKAVCARRWRSFVPGPFLAVFAGLAAFYGLMYHAFFSLSYQTPVTFRNYDSPHLAILAEHLRRAGFEDTGNIVGTRLGVYVEKDVFGTFVLDLFPAVVLDRPVWTTASSALFAGWVLLSYQLYIFGRRGLRLRRGLAMACAALGVVSPLVFFALGNGYMSQMYGTAMFIAGLTVMLTFRLDRRGITAAIVQLAVLSAALWHVYPFVAFAMPMFAFPLRFAVLPWRRWLRFGVIGGVVTLAAFIASALLTWGRFPTGLDQAIGQGSASAGWKLPGLWPQEIIGFTSTYAAFAGSRWPGAFVIVVLTIVALVVCRKRAAARVASMVVALGSLSYVAMYLRSGVSYQQWKWAAFITPVVVAGFAVLMVGLVCLVLRRTLQLTPERSRQVAAVATIGILAVTFTINVWRMTDQVFRLENKSFYISPELASLAGNKEIAEKDRLALRIKAWDSMWMTSMFPNTAMYHFSFWGYYPIERVGEPDLWMLERLDDASPPDRIAFHEPISDQYQLVTRKLSNLAKVEILHHTSAAKAGDNLQWAVRVTNSGNEPWVSTADDPNGGFTLRIGIVGSSYTVNENFVSQQLPQGVIVKPGESYVFVGDTINPETHNFSLQFDPYVERFGGLASLDPHSIAPVIVDRNSR